MSIFKRVLSKRRSIIFTWLISYIMILIIPVLVTMITYIKTVSIVENEINNSNILLLKKMQQQIDGVVQDVKNLSQEITFNSRINDLLRTRGSINDAPPYDIYQMIRDFRAYKMTNRSIDDFYIYYKNLDYVISANSGNSSRAFFDAYIGNGMISYEKWLDIATSYHKGEFLTIYDSENNGKADKKIAFIMTIPPINHGNNYANLFILIDDSKLMENAKYFEELNKGMVFILNKENNILFSSNKSKNIRDTKYEELKGDSGILLHERIGSEKVVVSYIDSQLIDWKYVTAIPESIFWDKVQYVRGLVVASLVFCLAIGGFIVIYSLKRNYNPVSKLVKALEKYQGQELGRDHNEYSFIQQAFDKAWSEKEKADSVIRQQNKVLKTEFLTRLLKGKEIERIPVEDSLLLHDIQFSSEYFAVMVFYIEDYSGIFFRGEKLSDTGDSFENYKMAQFVITNVVEELVGEKNQGFVADIDDMLVCLVNFKGTDLVEGKEELRKISDRAQQFIGEYFNISFMIAVSKIHETIAGVPEAYREALQAMEYKKVFGIEEILYFEEIQVLPKGDYYYPLEVEQQLINAIKTGDFGRSKDILDAIFHKNFDEVAVPLKIARCLLFDLVSTMLKTVNEISNISDDVFFEELNPIDRLLGCQKINEMKQELTGILGTICEYIECRNKSKDMEYRLVKKVMTYIEDNYHDVNLNVTSIAESFNMHPVYLSKIYKTRTGEGLLDYIHRERIKKAKLLIKEQPGNLDEIAGIVGYNNKHTLIRIFKKYEGITPGKYKYIEN